MDIKTTSLLTKLNNTNYFHWKQKMELLLLKENLHHTLTQEPPNQFADASTLTKWNSENNQARGLIGLALEDGQLIHVKNLNTAREMWFALKEIHERETITSQITTMKKLCKLQMSENEDVETHLNVISELIQQLSDMGTHVEEKWKIAILLSSMPETYDNVVDSLEARPERELTWGLVTSKLIDTYQKRKERNENTALKNLEKVLTIEKTKKFCNYCKRNNHNLPECIFLKKKLNKQNQKKDGSENSDEGETSYLFAIEETNIQQKTKEINWVLDSGSSHHICCQKEKFTSIKPLEKQIHMKLPNGDVVTAKEHGQCVIKSYDETKKSVKIIASDVLFIPQLKVNILSISKLTKKGYSIIFEKDDICKIELNKKLVATAKLKNNLFQLCEKFEFKSQIEERKTTAEPGTSSNIQKNCENKSEQIPENSTQYLAGLTQDMKSVIIERDTIHEENDDDEDEFIDAVEELF